MTEADVKEMEAKIVAACKDIANEGFVSIYNLGRIAALLDEYRKKLKQDTKRFE